MGVNLLSKTEFAINSIRSFISNISSLEKDTVEITPYTNGLLNRASEVENLVTGTLVKRVNSEIKYEGFITGTGWETAVLIP